MTARASRWRMPLINPLTALVTAAVLLALGAWLGASLVTSPRKAALDAGAPAPSVITARVESRKVEQEIITRGEARADRSIQVIGADTPAGASIALLSKPLPARGETLKAGSVAAEISGRPVFVLSGKVPMYRPLGPGATGPDVAQLQGALRAAGQEVAETETTFGDQTLAAAQSLYADAGYMLPAEGIPVGELVFVPSFPATVTAGTGDVGTLAADAQLVLASGSLAVTAAFPARQHQLLKQGDRVIISSEALGEEVPAKLGDLNLPAQADQADASTGRTVEIVPDKPLPSTWAGQGARVRIVTAASEDEVLAVPVSAVFMSSAGSPEVILVENPDPSDLRTKRIAVTVGAIGGGFAEITSTDAELNADSTVLLSSPAEE